MNAHFAFGEIIHSVAENGNPSDTALIYSLNLII